MAKQVSASTDADGRADLLLVRNEGLNIISASIDLPVKGNKDIDTRGLFTSLTFLGKAHH